MSCELKTLNSDIADIELKEIFAKHSILIDALSLLSNKEKLALCIFVRGGTIGSKDYDYIIDPDCSLSKASTIVSKLRIAGFCISSEYRRCRGISARNAKVYYLHREDLKRLMIEPGVVMRECRVTAIRRKKWLESKSIDRLVKDYGKLGTAKRVFKQIFGEMNAADVRSIEQCVNRFEDKAAQR